VKAALFFVTIACAVSVCQTGHATTTGTAGPSQEANPSAQRGPHSASADQRARKSIPVPKPANPRRAANELKSSATGKNANPFVQVPERGIYRTTIGSSKNSAEAGARCVRPWGTLRSAARVPGNVRHHGAGPASVGGPKSGTVGGTAALDGRAVSRRP
jgi:hypothetical protein